MTSEALWYLGGQEPAGISVAAQHVVMGSDACLSTIHRTQVPGDAGLQVAFAGL